MIALHHALAAGALVCALTAAAVPPRFDTVSIEMNGAAITMGSADIVLVPPDGYAVRTTRVMGDEQLQMELWGSGDDPPLYVSFVQGDGPPTQREIASRDGRPIFQTIRVPGTDGVGWRVGGGTVLVVAEQGTLDLLIEVIQRLEVYE